MKKTFAGIYLLFVAAIVCGQTTSEKLDEYLNASFNAGKFNGTALVYEKGNVLLNKAYGWKNAEKEELNDSNTMFQIGSVTKQFTSAVILKLVEQKKLSLQDKLSKFYPDFPEGSEITIENLLTHTSGIYNYTNNDAFMEKESHQPASEEKIMALFKDKPLDFEPGTKFSYSNSGYSMLGYIIQKVTGKKYETVVRQMIFQPLHMTHSGFDFTHLDSPDKAIGYTSLEQGKIKRAEIVDSSVAFSAGAIYTTTRDLLKWDENLNTDNIISKESWKNAFTPRKNKYGLGWVIDSIGGSEIITHSGGIDGFRSNNTIIPHDDIIIILFVNNESVNPSIWLDLFKILKGQSVKLPELRTEIKVDESILQQYVGEYELAPNFILTITLEDGQLKSQATGQQKVDLYAQKENYFFLKVVDAQIEFEKGADGKVEKLILYQNGRTIPAKKIK